MDILKGLGGILKHPIDEAKWMFDETKEVVKDPKEVKHVMGDHQRMMSKNITVPLLGDNKIAKNSDAIAGAIVGGALAAGGAAGSAGSAGASGTSGTAGASGTSATGGQGFFGNMADYFKPSTAGDKWGSLFEHNVTDEELGNLADAEAGGAHGNGAEALAKANGAKPTDWNQMARVLQSVKGMQSQGPQVPQAQARAAGFNYNSKMYENPLLTKTYADLYYKPHF
ncbi:hypothetical protein PQC38_gp110 [Aeromonas phage BUCT695]|uniref:hypothetical protein n=1 Tax=Aeromonas phage BUCT695 TaxID=2908630 RepID=UPI0023296B6F|nr:hypothetical protein PQC38_gp110 [Aeromonas phage BUCT695]UIW10586.1 hypothetical protein [Aeromonas phage BUCT695]